MGRAACVRSLCRHVGKRHGVILVLLISHCWGVGHAIGQREREHAKCSL